MPQTQVTEAQIAEAAFFIWQNEGQPDGQSQDHWFKAIEALKAETPKKKTVKKTAKPKVAAEKAAAPKAAAKPRAKKAAAK